MEALLAETVKHFREDCGMLHKDIYRFLGLPRSCYSSFESGGRVLKASELIKVLGIFGISFEVFMAKLEEIKNEN